MRGNSVGPLPPPPRQQTHFSLRDAVLMRARTHTHTHSRQTRVFPQAVSYTGQWVELDLYGHDQYHMAQFGYIVYMLVMCCSDILKRIVAFFFFWKTWDYLFLLVVIVSVC